MSLFKKLVLLCGICALSVQLSACASAVFPDINDDDDVTVSEGGRVLKSIPSEGTSLKADNKNAVYEGDNSKDDEVEDIVAEDKNIDAAADTSEEETVVTDEVIPVAEPVITADDDTPSISYRLDTFYFNNGSSSLDSKYNSAIRKIVKTAKANNADIIVYGYASSRTRNTDLVSHKVANFKVSYARAQSVVQALIRAGMPASKISAEALSDTAPMYQEVMPEGERLNRRAEVYISY